MPETEVMLDVRRLARALAMPPIELVREMQIDNVPLIPISAKRWRVTKADYDAWIERRKARAAEMAQQQRMRLGHIAGKSTTTNRATSKVRFRR